MSENPHLRDDKVNEFRTICEVHREIYDILEAHLSDHPEFKTIVKKLEEANLMAKRMDLKLRQYKFNYGDDFWERESEALIAEKTRIRRRRV